MVKDKWELSEVISRKDLLFLFPDRLKQCESQSLGLSRHVNYYMGSKDPYFQCCINGQFVLPDDFDRKNMNSTIGKVYEVESSDLDRDWETSF